MDKPRKKSKVGETGIKTIYYRYKKEPKILKSKNANRAVTTCVAHMQINHYEAELAEVYDAATGELHASVKRKMNGDLMVYLKRDPLQYETKYAIGHLLNL